MIAGSAPSTPEQQARMRRAMLIAALIEAPLVLAGVVAYLATGLMWPMIACIAAGGLVVVFMVVRTAAGRSAPGDDQPPRSNTDIVQ